MPDLIQVRERQENYPVFLRPDRVTRDTLRCGFCPRHTFTGVAPTITGYAVDSSPWGMRVSFDVGLICDEHLNRAALINGFYIPRDNEGIFRAMRQYMAPACDHSNPCRPVLIGRLGHPPCMTQIVIPGARFRDHTFTLLLPQLAEAPSGERHTLYPYFRCVDAPTPFYRDFGQWRSQTTMHARVRDWPTEVGTLTLSHYMLHHIDTICAGGVWGDLDRNDQLFLLNAVHMAGGDALGINYTGRPGRPEWINTPHSGGPRISLGQLIAQLAEEYVAYMRITTASSEQSTPAPRRPVVWRGASFHRLKGKLP